MVGVVLFCVRDSVSSFRISFSRLYTDNSVGTFPTSGCSSLGVLPSADRILSMLDENGDDMKVVDVSDRLVTTSVVWHRRAGDISPASGTGPNGRRHGTVDKHAAFRGVKKIMLSLKCKIASHSCLVSVPEGVLMPGSFKCCKVPTLRKLVRLEWKQGLTS